MLAYLDTFAGLVPCRIIGRTVTGSWRCKVTATRGGYARGSVDTWGARSVVPRDCVRQKRGHAIVLPYDLAARFDAANRKG